MLAKMPVGCLILFLVLLTACAPLPQTLGQRDMLFQAATLSALNAGGFDGTLTIGELKQHGDFGLGTFNALDGEMVVLAGQVYQARDDGTAALAEDTAQTPFAAVTYFDTDQTFTIGDAADCAALQAEIDAALPTLDAPYAIKASGEFTTLQVRAPHMQSAPYPTLTDALADQVVFASQNISGTLVGFRLPEYLAGANAAGYHFHFISADEQHGGHVLECQPAAVTVEVDTIDTIYIELPAVDSIQ